jgi:hypothetical protein
LPKFGFGRHELLPIKKTGEAVAAYISKYIEKNVCNRTPADRRKKLVRYFGWQKQQLKPNEFEWDGKRARAWRAKTAQVFKLAGCELRDAVVNPPRRILDDCASAAGKIRPKMLDGSQIKEKFGARWAMTGTAIWCEVEGDNKLPFIEWTPQRVLDAQELLGRAEKKFISGVADVFAWCKGLDINRILREAGAGNLQNVEFPPLAFDNSDDARRYWWKMESEYDNSAAFEELSEVRNN